MFRHTYGSRTPSSTPPKLLVTRSSSAAMTGMSPIAAAESNPPDWSCFRVKMTRCLRLRCLRYRILLTRYLRLRYMRDHHHHHLPKHLLVSLTTILHPRILTFFHLLHYSDIHHLLQEKLFKLPHHIGLQLLQLHPRYPTHPLYLRTQTPTLTSPPCRATKAHPIGI